MDLRHALCWASQNHSRHNHTHTVVVFQLSSICICVARLDSLTAIQQLDIARQLDSSTATRQLDRPRQLIDAQAHGVSLVRHQARQELDRTLDRLRGSTGKASTARRQRLDGASTARQLDSQGSTGSTRTLESKNEYCTDIQLLQRAK